MEQPKELTKQELQMTVFSLQKQVSEQIGKFTNADVELMKLQQENEELKKQLEEYQKREIEEMNQGE